MLTRDQSRAFKAYEAVSSVQENDRKDYKIAVHALGAEILQDGLAAAMAGLERREGRANLLRTHLAEAAKAGLIPGLQKANSSDEDLRSPVTKDNLPGKVRALDLDGYILATRETLQYVLWLKRAVQAKFDGV